MDDGAEGFMTPHVTRQGIPVCNRGNTCGVINSDQLFATNRYHVSNAGRARLAEFSAKLARRATLSLATQIAAHLTPITCAYH